MDFSWMMKFLQENPLAMLAIFFFFMWRNGGTTNLWDMLLAILQGKNPFEPKPPAPASSHADDGCVHDEHCCVECLLEVIEYARANGKAELEKEVIALLPKVLAE